MKSKRPDDGVKYDDSHFGNLGLKQAKSDIRDDHDRKQSVETNVESAVARRKENIDKRFPRSACRFSRSCLPKTCRAMHALLTILGDSCTRPNAEAHAFSSCDQACRTRGRLQLSSYCRVWYGVFGNF